jgi:hypothetical protein
MVSDDISPDDRFWVLLEWMLALDGRHADVLQPGLVHITYDPSDIRDLTFGAHDAAQKLREVMDCLRDSFRSTDTITRKGTGFWILAPFTQIDPVVEKVRKVIQTAPQNGLAIAQSNVRIYMLHDHVTARPGGFADVDDFLEYLQTVPEAILPT